MTDDEQRRIKMEAALFEGDDAQLGTLLKEDTRLSSYAEVLQGAAVYGRNPAHIQKLLDHPALYQGSDLYKKAVHSAFTTLGANREDADLSVLKMLFDRFKDDQQLKDQSLRFIFSVVAEMGLESRASVAATKMLIENGADLTHAYQYQMSGLASQEQAIRDGASALRTFKSKVITPAA